jgi:hypothetical protein
VKPFVADLSKVKAVKVDWEHLTKSELDPMREDFRNIYGQ